MKYYISYLLFDDYDEKSLFDCFVDDIRSCSKRFVVTPNLDFLRMAYRDPQFRKILNEADYSTIDGKPLLRLAKKTNKSLKPHKISGSDMVNDFLPVIDENGWSVLIVGGKEGVGDKAAQNIKKSYPNIVVSGVICPEFGFEKDEKKTKEVVDAINDYNSDVVLICLGAPKQEKLYYLNKDSFKKGLFFCVGATVDFLAGTTKRAPRWISKIGLEWFYRMTKDFGRLFPRYFKDGLFLIKLKWLLTFNKKRIISLR